ncbi:hypothetical protein PG279_10395 [Riemerella anatipestifer]|nr:hypothetical protein [Riemerella anatipestifer]
MKISKLIPISRNLYENFYDESFYLEFICPNSFEKKEINILKDFGYLDDLVTENILQKDDIIKNGIALSTNKHNNYLGLFSIYNNLSAKYKFITCEQKFYIIVFDYGEVQTGRNILYISGIWEVELSEQFKKRLNLL